MTTPPKTNEQVALELTTEWQIQCSILAKGGPLLARSKLIEMITAALDAKDAKHEQQVAKLREALEHYAKGAPFIGFDRGEIARAALAKEPK